jgi:signal transduction histidine kinase
VADDRVPAADALPAFAAAVAHEIRTPLAAVAGEIDLALCRDRSAEEYREALRRIGEGVAELVEITADLSLLNDVSATPTVLAYLDTVLARVSDRFAAHHDVTIDAGGAGTIKIAADEARLGRAIALVIEHAVRHRRNDAKISLRVAQARGRARLLVEAQAPGFWPRAWRSLSDGGDDPATPLRLRTARRIVGASGGTIAVSSAADGHPAAVVIDLPLA